MKGTNRQQTDQKHTSAVLKFHNTMPI